MSMERLRKLSLTANTVTIATLTVIGLAGGWVWPLAIIGVSACLAIAVAVSRPPEDKEEDGR